MTDFWTTGPTAAALSLRALGFSPQEAQRLVALKIRCERKDFWTPTQAQKRLLFVRWLVAHGRLSDWAPAQSMAGERSPI